MGLLQLEFTLSEEPELGEWKIHFMAGPVSSKTGFKVSEYVLPKFEVRCQLLYLYFTTRVMAMHSSLLQVVIKPPSAVLRDSKKVDYEVGTSLKGKGCPKYKILPGLWFLHSRWQRQGKHHRYILLQSSYPLLAEKTRGHQNCGGGGRGWRR